MFSTYHCGFDGVSWRYVLNLSCLSQGDKEKHDAENTRHSKTNYKPRDCTPELVTVAGTCVALFSVKTQLVKM